MAERPWIIAIDPGPEVSAAVVYDGQIPRRLRLEPTDEMLAWLRRGAGIPGASGSALRWPLAIEQVRSYGMAVGATTFDTVHVTGRMHEIWASHGCDVALMPRMQVKTHLCHSSRASDANIRQALMDRYGSTRREAIGVKASPGPLYGMRSHLWAALALAVTYWETIHAPQHQGGASG